MSELDDHLAPPPPPDPERMARLARRAHRRLAGEEPRPSAVEGALVGVFSVATLVWAVVAVAPIA